MSHQDPILNFLSFLFLVCPIVSLSVCVKTYRKCMVGKNWPKVLITDRITRDFLKQGGRKDSFEERLAPQRKVSGLRSLAPSMPALSKCHSVVRD